MSVANHPGAPVSVEWIERTCVENNAGFGGGAVGVPAHATVIARWLNLRAKAPSLQLGSWPASRGEAASRTSKIRVSVKRPT